MFTSKQILFVHLYQIWLSFSVFKALSLQVFYLVNQRLNAQLLSLCCTSCELHCMAPDSQFTLLIQLPSLCVFSD